MTNDIIILGIHDGHNAGAALIKNGSAFTTIQENGLIKKNTKHSLHTIVISPKIAFLDAMCAPKDNNLLSRRGSIKVRLLIAAKNNLVIVYELVLELSESLLLINRMGVEN